MKKGKKSTRKGNKIWVFSLGGSIIVPRNIDTPYLKAFSKLVIKYVKKGHSFRIVCGGGYYCRKYIEAVSNSEFADDKEEDKIGILVTRLNAEVLKRFFPPELCYNKVVIDYYKWKGNRNNKAVVIGAGARIGHSTDYDTVLFALSEGVEKLINITNVGYVYNKDPKKYRSAKPLKRLRWEEYLKIIGEEFKPGGNYPFDPVASKLCWKKGIQVIITSKDLKNIEKILENKEFEGTILY